MIGGVCVRRVKSVSTPVLQPLLHHMHARAVSRSPAFDQRRGGLDRSNAPTTTGAESRIDSNRSRPALLQSQQRGAALISSTPQHGAWRAVCASRLLVTPPRKSEGTGRNPTQTARRAVTHHPTSERQQAQHRQEPKQYSPGAPNATASRCGRPNQITDHPLIDLRTPQPNTGDLDERELSPPGPSTHTTARPISPSATALRPLGIGRIEIETGLSSLLLPASCRG